MLVLSKLIRAYENFDDDEDTDIGREWLNALTLMGLLRKIKRGRWEITEEGDVAVRAILEPTEESVQRVTEKALLRQQEQANLEKIHAARDEALREAGVCMGSGAPELPHNCT